MNFLVARKSVMIMCARVCVHFGGGGGGGRREGEREKGGRQREGESVRIRTCLLGGGRGLSIRKFKPVSLQVSTR